MTRYVIDLRDKVFDICKKANKEVDLDVTDVESRTACDEYRKYNLIYNNLSFTDYSGF
jgi:hypothetical protein